MVLARIGLPLLRAVRPRVPIEPAYPAARRRKVKRLSAKRLPGRRQKQYDAAA